MALKLWKAGNGGAKRLASGFELKFQKHGVGRTTKRKLRFEPGTG